MWILRSCEETARLVSERHDRRLSFLDQVRLRLHLAMCFLCRNFSRQIDMVRKLSRALGRSGPDSLVAQTALLDQSLSPESKSRMRDALAREK
jgi:predicted anti-sigma-YlaC factor YlaD